MNDLRSALEEYLALRQGLGFVLQHMAGALRSFVTLAEKEGASHITTELALRWACEPPDAKPATWARKLGTVRKFAIWRSATDPRTEVPPDGLLPHRYERCSPHIYTNVEIESIVREAAVLPSHGGLRGLSCSTLYGLLSVTGMRVSEGLALDRDDVDLGEGVLAVRRTKFGKSRYVPVHD